MSPIVTFGVGFIALYLVQSVFSWKQIKAFNQEFLELRRKGRVVVGKRSGRIAAGTILLFLVNEKGEIVKGKKMQGVTVFSRFGEFADFNGLKMVDLNPNHPLVKKQIKFTRLAIENGRELYIRFLAGAMEQEKYSAITPFGVSISYTWGKLKNKFKNS